MKLGIIGLGHMGQAILKGLINAGFEANNIYIHQRTEKQGMALATQYQCHWSAQVTGLAQNCDVVILAVSANNTPAVLKQMTNSLKPTTVVVSLAAKVTLQALQAVSAHSEIVRIIPNIPVSVNAGISLMGKTTLSTTSYQYVQTVFSKLGQLVEVDEQQLEVGAVLSGCTPAFFAIFIEALADAGVKYGLSRELAYTLAAQAATGSGRLLVETELIPAQLKDYVASPGGTTIKGIAALEDSGIRAGAIKAVSAILESK